MRALALAVTRAAETGVGRGFALTTTLAALAIFSLLRSGRPKASASSSNTSPVSGLIPSENDSVAVPK